MHRLIETGASAIRRLPIPPRPSFRCRWTLIGAKPAVASTDPLVQLGRKTALDANLCEAGRGLWRRGLHDHPLRTIARELVATVRHNGAIDWTLGENVRARLRFDRPDTGKIAVKVINHYKDEVLKVLVERHSLLRRWARAL